jgi:hypothetical protein
VFIDFIRVKVVISELAQSCFIAMRIQNKTRAKLSGFAGFSSPSRISERSELIHLRHIRISTAKQRLAMNKLMLIRLHL